MLNPYQYYRSAEVRERIAEYCGGTAREPALCTCEYMVGYGEALIGIPAPEPYVSTPRTGFDYILDKGLDIFRSLWDRVSLPGVLDIEYFNLDYPGQVYFDQVGTFERMEPVYRTILELFRSYEIEPLVLMTGQGYHFSFQVQAGTRAALRLEDFGKLNPSLAEKYRQTRSKRHRPVSLRYGKAFDGMGRVMDFFVHEIIRRAADQTDLPLVITDVAIGNGEQGREGMSLDLSCFGDPVYMRDCRCAFSTHQKHKIQRYKVGDSIADGTPIQVAVPRKGISLKRALHLRRHFRDAAAFAETVHCFIPNFSVNFKKIISDYENSEIRKFHLHYDDAEQHPPSRWAETYGALNFQELPPCLRLPLMKPNDLLLKPTNLQTLTRVLLAKGWHPQHIAGLVRSRWVDGPGWPAEQWDNFDAGSRSSFYVRTFAGLIADGLDEMEDLNCVSHQEKGYCPQPFCGYNLADYQGEK